METMRSLGVTALIELPPAGTLTGIAKRALRVVRLLPIKTPDDLDSARHVIAEAPPADAALAQAPASQEDVFG
jgi:[acyl-carrier-protein] S-malonyltransferase